MVVDGDIVKESYWSKQALERLAQDGLVPTPRNYAVYYYYFSASNPELVAAFNALEAQGPMSQKNCDHLYDRYVASESEMSFFKDASSIIDSELKKVMDLLSTSAKETDQFGENLDHFTGKLSQANSLSALREAVEKIADETRSITAQNGKLRVELAATTMQLGEIRSDYERAHKESQIDPLTEVGNRKFFDRELRRTMGEAKEQKTLLSLLIIDIDHFKHFNDLQGHLVGDQVLRLVAHTLVENLKGRDIIARYGGDEFVILMPQTRLEDAAHVANQLRSALATKRITKRTTNETLGVITISIGAAVFDLGEDGDMFISRADKALYKAKQSGRNRLICAGDEEKGALPKL